MKMISINRKNYILYHILEKIELKDKHILDPKIIAN